MPFVILFILKDYPPKCMSPVPADLFRNNVLEKGNSEDPMTLYKNFRGTEPQLEPMLKNRGMK